MRLTRLAALFCAAGLVACVDGPAPAIGGAGDCTPPASLADADDDLSIFGTACASTKRFVEGGEKWRIDTIRSGRPGPLFVLPHDNEDAALETAAYALSRYGGAVTMVETGGKRLNGKIDPNRNFGGGRLTCPAGAPLAFTSAMLAPGGSPIIALHSNDRGTGTISIRRPYSDSSAFESDRASGGRASEDALVILASTQGTGDNAVMAKVRALNAAGVNVIVETVYVTRTDCSLSHYAVAHGLDYANIEVPHGDAATQKEILDILLPIL